MGPRHTMAPSNSSKRKLPLGGLQRRVRARVEEPDSGSEEASSNGSDDEGPSEEEVSQGSSDGDEDVSENDSALDTDLESDEEDPSAAVSQVSFGALAKAASSLPSARKKNRKSTDQDSDSESHSVPRSHPNSKTSSKPPKPHRSSKHAPTEMTSKRAVSRKRQVVDVPKREVRDPRFSAALGPAMDESRMRSAYGFLDTYRDAEMAQLRAQIKKTRNVGEKESLRRALASLQSKAQAQARRDAERNVVAEHRRQEKELVAQGKTPFYLKKSEQKKRLLTERYKGMKKGQVDKAIERRRKKVTARERRDMPMERRTLG
ncbi:hypothetical protein F5Y15DRAFT_330355 [Xylariaceae sp. FL0016]|nr:hypothetical protein F5Y15DRAFT_330355 [Xylariaceae sp. FL0016]